MTLKRTSVRRYVHVNASTKGSPAAMWLQLTLLGALFLARFAFAADYYVASTGSDLNPGTRSKPFASLERARAAVRQRKAVQSALREPITVWLRGGDYLRTN